ncbi:unannotated protein [freshwater metagenome]|uniref:Unannotated protein n=1 Tax=freshwater metagenome TaxID=449393 RepID=A0A6J6T5T5_9ZZZZ
MAYLIIVDGTGNTSTSSAISFTTSAVVVEPPPPPPPVVVETKSVKVRTPRPIIVVEAPVTIADKAIVFVYDANALDNVEAIRIALEELRDFIPIISESFNSETLNLNDNQVISDEFIRILVAKEGIQNFMTLVSDLQRNSLNSEDYIKAFKNIYGKSPIDWYLQEGAPRILSKYALKNTSEILFGVTNIDNMDQVTSNQSFTPRILERSFDAILRTILVNTSGTTKFDLLITNSRNTKNGARIESIFESIYGVTFKEWFTTVGLDGLRANLGLTAISANKVVKDQTTTELVSTGWLHFPKAIRSRISVIAGSDE